MISLLQYCVVAVISSVCIADVPSSLNFDYLNFKDEIYEQPVNMMTPKKSPHAKDQQAENIISKPAADSWAPYDFSKFESYLADNKDGDQEYNRIKRSAKRRRGHGGRKRGKNTTPQSDRLEVKNVNGKEEKEVRRNRKKSKKDKPNYETYEPPIKEWESGYVEMPKDLYQAHLRPGVIFRIHMAEAVLKMQYRNYGEDKDESVIEADVEYLRLTRKVINDEITKFEDLKWLISWFNNRSELIQEHTCNTRYFAVGMSFSIYYFMNLAVPVTSSAWNLMNKTVTNKVIITSVSSVCLFEHVSLLKYCVHDKTSSTKSQSTSSINIQSLFYYNRLGLSKVIVMLMTTRLKYEHK